MSLDQFERALAGDRSTRFDLAKAIVDRDAKAFDTAMQAFVAEELRTRADEKKSAGHGREDASVLWARAEISVEGLAFLKAGELCSLAVTSELPLCPKLARLPWTGVTFPDLFEELAQADTEPA